MKVTLRQRRKSGKISLYLDIYDKGKRFYEYLGLYMVPEPGNGKTLSRTEKEVNKETMLLAENIRAKRQLEYQSGKYGFESLARMNGSFISYMEQLVRKRKNSLGNHGNWDSALKHLKRYARGDVSFSQIDRKWLEGFKDYLSREARTKLGMGLSQNSQNSYYSKIRAALKEAKRDGILKLNPAEQVSNIKPGDTERAFLTLEELQSAAKTACELPQLKSAFLFSALTGLRFSDIQKLIWSEIQHSNENGYYIRFTQKKTGGAETLPISEEAVNLLGERGAGDLKVFPNLRYSAWHNIKLKDWIRKAGVDKNITFHCARHTYATLQLTFGTDIYTVSKLLGHKDLKTTQVYAKIIDEKKREAALKIKLSL